MSACKSLIYLRLKFSRMHSKQWELCGRYLLSDNLVSLCPSCITFEWLVPPHPFFLEVKDNKPETDIWVIFQVADELVAEFADPCNSLTTPDQVFHKNSHENVSWKLRFWFKIKSWLKCWTVLCWQQQYDEKNIRRRVYDALNVLMAMDIISKDKKEIQWKGLPRTSQDDIEELKV